MVLVTHDYCIYLYSEGVLRSCSARFSLDDLSDRFAHLANHCLQEQHPHYGKHEDLNLLSYANFDRFLGEIGRVGPDGCPIRLDSHILPQIEDIVVYTVLAVKDHMEVLDTASYRCFNLLGFDFMLDDSCNVYLVEVNSSPTTDPRLIPRLVEEIVCTAVDPLYPRQHASRSLHPAGSTADSTAFATGAFKLLHGARARHHPPA